MKRPVLSAAMPLKMLPADQVKWVQNQLKIGGYYSGEIDGICGPMTLNAFNKFKDDFYLGQPGAIGESSIDSLASLEAKHQTSEQDQNRNQRPNPNAGRKSGGNVMLPLVRSVWGDQWVDEDFPFFTWSELTKGLTRLPDTESLVRNAQRLVQVCGEIRRQHGVIWTVTSGYRPPAVNRAVGGVPNSLHTRFRAMDVYPANGDLGAIVRLARKHPGIGGIGINRSFIHLDLGFDENDLTPVKREFGY